MAMRCFCAALVFFRKKVVVMIKFFPFFPFLPPSSLQSFQTLSPQTERNTYRARNTTAQSISIRRVKTKRKAFKQGIQNTSVRDFGSRATNKNTILYKREFFFIDRKKEE